MPYSDNLGAFLLRAVPAAMFAAIVVAGAGAQEQPNVAPQNMRERALADGRIEFQMYCRTCHGDSGKGDGKMASILTTKPADLTRISSKNGGQFPFWKIFATIAGDVRTAGHDMFEMPGFWSRFEQQSTLPGYASPQLRLLALTHYVESLQQGERSE